jgi:hypothetical protein
MRPGFCQCCGNLQVHFTAANFKSPAYELGVSGIIIYEQYLQGLVCHACHFFRVASRE